MRLPTTVLVLTVTASVPARAQTRVPAPVESPAPAVLQPVRPEVTWSAQFNSAQNAGVGLSAVVGRPRTAGIVLGPSVEAAAGIDAGKLGLGLGGVMSADRFHSPAAFGLALQAVLLRTWRETSAAPDPTTYAGAELKVTLSTLRLSGGCLWRVGDAPNSKRVRGVWGVGIGF
jgi:hypothetical protein